MLWPAGFISRAVEMDGRIPGCCGVDLLFCGVLPSCFAFDFVFTSLSADPFGPVYFPVS